MNKNSKLNMNFFASLEDSPLAKNLVSDSLPPALRKMSIFPLVLIVDEDDETRLMLRYLLGIWKYPVLEAGSGEEAVKIACADIPDLVLMNTKLPGIDGLTTSKRMREFSELSAVKIIFISAESNKQTRASADACGVDDFFLKPIDFDTLENLLEKYSVEKFKTTKTAN